MELYNKINEVFIRTVKMYDLTLKYLEQALSSLDLDDNLVDTHTTINDDLIDKDLLEIEKDCLTIILKERPFANDLRKITGIFKLVDDIERLGDHSEDIAWCIEKMKKHGYHNESIPSLKEIVEVSFQMVKNSYQALIKDDITIANDVIKSDDLVDKLYIKVLKEIRVFEINSDVSVYLTLLCKYIERLADHASNIAEWAIYINSGFYKEEIVI